VSSPGALRSLPSVDLFLRHAGVVPLLERYPRALVTEALRSALDEARGAVLGGRTGRVPEEGELLERAAAWLRAVETPSLRAVVNATGVILHTNLGRALLADEARAAVDTAAGRPLNLELDLDAGGRGERDSHVEGHLCALSGAEAATVVNNNAAAVLLALNSLAQGREVIVSRGELVEIGGSFRIPEILAKSGAVLREVGTTNRTHAGDYERAINERTALLLKVHPSNYRITGFTAGVDLGTLVELGQRRGLAVMEDLGSGALVDLAAYGLPREPLVAERVELGPDVVTFSGDKLLGGPQAGILVGKREAVEAMRRNPLKRALRCDKLTLAALEATLRLYRTERDLAARLPTLRALTRSLDDLRTVGNEALVLLREQLGTDYEVELRDSEAEIGSGALPTERVASKAIVLRHASQSAAAIAALFRRAAPPILGRIHDDHFWLDLRCVWNASDVVPNLLTPDS
jgi:L-seryl-tRNA(Ser) seleniumtransferase